MSILLGHTTRDFMCNYQKHNRKKKSSLAAWMHNESTADLRFLFEWLSPPFDAGHWMPDMMQWACVDHACSRKADRKSKDWPGMVICPEMVWGLWGYIAVASDSWLRTLQNHRFPCS